MTRVNVELGDRAYPIEIGRGQISQLPKMIEEKAPDAVVAVVSDSNVAPLFGGRVEKLLTDAGRTVHSFVMEPGEANKRLTQIETLTGQALEAGLDRTSVVVALGGGVVGDTAGFFAASFMRGIPYIQVPTTIVAQVDSSVGGKTAVNHPSSKNIIGAFHQPLAVVVDLDFLTSLPERELRAGLAEVIKHGIIADEALFTYMEEHAKEIRAYDLDALEHLVVRSCEIKSAIVAEDETEQGIRSNLNYGHTFGHGIEAATQYEEFLHGEAISLGMICAGALARSLDMVDDAFVARQRACIEAYALPVVWPGLKADATLDAMRRDKKVKHGTMKFVLADGMGHVVQRTDISEVQALEALNSIA